jgi:hypothetical protein
LFHASTTCASRTWTGRLLAAGERLYAQARHRVDTSRLGVDQAVLAIEGLAAA